MEFDNLLKLINFPQIKTDIYQKLIQKARNIFSNYPCWSSALTNDSQPGRNTVVGQIQQGKQRPVECNQSPLQCAWAELVKAKLVLSLKMQADIAEEFYNKTFQRLMKGRHCSLSYQRGSSRSSVVKQFNHNVCCIFTAGFFLKKIHRKLLPLYKLNCSNIGCLEAMFVCLHFIL